MMCVSIRPPSSHDYQKLDLEIVRSIVTEHLEDFTDFTTVVLSENSSE